MKKLILFLIFTLLLFYSPALVFADACISLPLGKEREDCYQKILDSLASQANTLAGQIAFYDAQIKLVLSKITQTEDQIVSISAKINFLEDKLQEKSRLLETQIRLSYKQGQLDPLRIFLSSDDVSQLISRFKYLQIVQSTNRRFLAETQTIQNSYSQQKTLIQDSQKKLDAQKKNLASIRVERDNLLKQTKNSEASYQKLLAQAKAQLAAIRNFVSGRATILNNQTVCDGWGCYYNQRDSQWGNIGLGGSNLSTAEYGCLVSSSAMIATHYGKNLKPLDIAINSGAFFLGSDKETALLWDTITVNGVTIRRIKGQSRSTAENELSAGRPVIAELFGGGHFIVLKSGSNGNYIMNDPFTENGHDINFPPNTHLTI